MFLSLIRKFGFEGALVLWFFIVSFNFYCWSRVFVVFFEMIYFFIYWSKCIRKEGLYVRRK